MNKYNLVTNGLIDNFVLDEKGKGHKFVSKFIEAGLVHYKKYGDILITKETLDKFIGTMVGCPVIINHKQVTDDNVENERVGVISNVWFNPSDGWYYCDGIIWNKQAIDLVKNQGWNVSCAYSFESDRKPLKYHGKTISMEFTNGNFQHLAIVETPRYEDANIVINSVEFDESKHPRDEQGKFTSLNKTQSDEIIDWITIKGEYLPIRKGETKEYVLDRFFSIRQQKHIRTQIEMLKNNLEKQNEKLKRLKQGNDFNAIKQKEEKIERIKNKIYELEKNKKEISSEIELTEDEQKQKEAYIYKIRKKEVEEEEKRKKELELQQKKRIEAYKNYQKKLEEKYGNLKVYIDKFEDAEEISGGGYYRYSMSNRAKKAYLKGFVPKSKLTKKQQEIAKLLGRKEWHHSSKYANVVYFYDKNLIELIEKNVKDEDLKKYLEIENKFNTSAWENYNNDDYKKWLDIKNKLHNTVNNGFVTLDRVDETGKRQVIWIPENVHWVPSKEKSRVYKICKEHKNGDETKFNFEHTRVKPTKEQIEYLKNTLNDIKNKYKFKDIAQIEISSSLNRGSLGVCYAPQNASLISLSPQLYNGKYTQDKYEKGVKDGWNPKGTGDMIKSVLTHEIGHSITCNSNDNGFWTKIAKIKIDYMKNITSKDVENPDFISNYARTNKYEFVAEAFCQGTLSKKYGKYTDQVMNVIKEHFGKTYQTKLALNALEETQGEMWIEGFGFGYPIDELEYNKFREEFDKLQKTEKNQQVKNSIETKRKENLVMTALNDLENFVKNIVSNACEKDKEKGVMNEDKRKLIDEVGGILKGKVDDEIIRTIIGKLEKIAYEPSEDDKAVNKCKNEGEKDKKEFIKEKEIATGKKDTVENSMDKVRKAIYSSSQVDSSSVYMTREERIEQGNEY